MPIPFDPLEPGRTRDLTSAEWRAIAAARRPGRWLAGMIGAVFLAFAAVSAYGGYADSGNRSVPPSVVIGLVFVFGVPGVAFWNAAYLAASARPWTRARRVGRLRGIVGVDGRWARTTIGGVGVRLPNEWAGALPVGTSADVEVTPPVAPGDSWLTRHAVRDVVSAHEGRLWIGDLASETLARAARSRH